MARSQLNDVAVTVRTMGADKVLVALPGASVQVNLSSGGFATVYTTETGGTVASNPIIADAFGRFTGWLDDGSYNLIVNHPSGIGYTVPLDLGGGGGGGGGGTLPTGTDGAVLAYDSGTSAWVPSSLSVGPNEGPNNESGMTLYGVPIYVESDGSIANTAGWSASPTRQRPGMQVTPHASVYSWDFRDGVAGVSVTANDPPSPDWIDSTTGTTASGVTCVYANDILLSPLPNAVKIGTTVASAVRMTKGFRSYGHKTLHHGRMYLYLDAVNTQPIILFALTWNQSNEFTYLMLGSDRKLDWLDHPARSPKTPGGTTALAAATWYRIEWKVDHVAQTARCELYQGHSTSVLETFTVTTGIDFRPYCDGFKVGSWDAANLGAGKTFRIAAFAEGSPTPVGPYTGTDSEGVSLRASDGSVTPFEITNSGEIILRASKAIGSDLGPTPHYQIQQGAPLVRLSEAGLIVGESKLLGNPLTYDNNALPDIMLLTSTGRMAANSYNSRSQGDPSDLTFSRYEGWKEDTGTGATTTAGVGISFADMTKGGDPAALYMDDIGKSLHVGKQTGANYPGTKTITNVVNNGSGLIRVTATGHNANTGYTVTISSVGGVTAANGTWIITVIDGNTFDLQGSTFAGPYTSGGTAAFKTGKIDNFAGVADHIGQSVYLNNVLNVPYVITAVGSPHPDSVTFSSAPPTMSNAAWEIGYNITALTGPTSCITDPLPARTTSGLFWRLNHYPSIVKTWGLGGGTAVGQVRTIAWTFPPPTTRVGNVKSGASGVNFNGSSVSGTIGPTGTFTNGSGVAIDPNDVGRVLLFDSDPTKGLWEITAVGPGVNAVTVKPSAQAGTTGYAVNPPAILDGAWAISSSNHDGGANSWGNNDVTINMELMNDARGFQDPLSGGSPVRHVGGMKIEFSVMDPEYMFGLGNNVDMNRMTIYGTGEVEIPGTLTVAGATPFPANKYRLIHRAFAYMRGNTTVTGAGTWPLGLANIQQPNTASNQPVAFYLDPNDHAITGYLTKLRIRAGLVVNATAPGITFTFELRPVGTPVGASGIIDLALGAVVGNTAVVTPPALSTKTAPTVGADFDFPAAGWYALAMTCGSTPNAASVVTGPVVLEVRNV